MTFVRRIECVPYALASTGRIRGEAANITAAYAMDRGVVRPMMTAAGDGIAISDPATGEVVLVESDSLEIVQRISIGGQARRAWSL